MLMHADFAEHAEPGLKRDCATCRWMIRIAIICLVGGAGVILCGAVCILLSLRSQRAQYLSLSAGWHVLRLVSVVQIVGQGILIVALSYWVTALLANTCYSELICGAVIVVIAAVVLLLKGIFKRVKFDFPLSGRLIEKSAAPVLWEDPESLCQELDTGLPDQLIAGIDDCFL